MEITRDPLGKKLIKKKDNFKKTKKKTNPLKTN